MDYEGNTDRFANVEDADTWNDTRDYDNPFDPWNSDNEDWDDRG